PRRRQGQPVGTPILLRGAAADPRERRLGLVALPQVGQLHLEDLAADAVLELVTGPFRDHAAVVDDGDLVRELIGFFEVLRRQQDRRSLAAQVADDLPDLVATARIETCRRLGEEEHTRLCKQAGRQGEPRRMPPEDVSAARPAARARSVARMRISVVLPAPVGPRRPKTMPSGISRSTPARAVVDPNRLTTPAIRTAGGWLRGEPVGLILRPCHAGPGDAAG